MSLLFFCLLLSAVLVGIGVAAPKGRIPRIWISLAFRATEARAQAAYPRASGWPRILGRWPIRKLRR